MSSRSLAAPSSRTSVSAGPSPDPRLNPPTALTDPVGVLSIYTNDRLTRAHFDALASSLARTSSRRDERAVRRRLTQLAGDLPSEVDMPGRAVFAGIAEGRSVDIALPAEVTPYIAVDQFAHVRPLVVTTQDAHPAGVVVLSAKQLTVFEARGLALQELDVVDLAAQESLRRWRRGSRGAPSAPARQPGPSLEGHARSQRERATTAVGAFARHVAQLAAARRWDLVTVTGDRKLMSAFRARYPTWRSDLVELSVPGALRTTGTLAAGVAAETARTRRERVAGTVAEIVDDPATVWGIEPIAAALSRGRVAELVLADDLEPRTAEALIRRAIPAAARLIPTDAGVLGPLSVAARARW
jgi:hypothetical protein